MALTGPPMPTFTIADLVSRTGVPAATIHHYLRSGLLPRPKKVAPNRFVYDERHVRALKLIRTLRGRRARAVPTPGGPAPAVPRSVRRCVAAPSGLPGRRPEGLLPDRDRDRTAAAGRTRDRTPGPGRGRHRHRGLPGLPPGGGPSGL